MSQYYLRAVIGLSFALAFGLVYAVAESMGRNRRRLRQRLAGLASRPPEAPASTPANGPRPDVLPTLTGWLRGRDRERSLRLAILRADLRLRPAEWVTLCGALSLLSALVGLLLTHGLLAGLILGLLGLLVPQAVLSARQAARRNRFAAQLPDALLLLASDLRAGHSFAQALATAAEELPPPLSEEFAWAGGEAALGIAWDTALGRMVERVQSPDLDLIVTAILIQLPIGGNLAEVLDAIAATIRERVRVSGEVRTLTAEGRLSALVLMALAPALALLFYLRDPAYFQPLLALPTGRLLLGGAFAGQVVGALIIRRMVAVEV